MTPQRLLRLRIDAKQALQTGAGVNAHRVLELLDAYDLIRDREEILMWDLTIKQLEKIHEGLQLLVLKGDRQATLLADQFDIVIAARRAETVAPQGTMRVDLKGR